MRGAVGPLVELAVPIDIPKLDEQGVPLIFILLTEFLVFFTPYYLGIDDPT